MNKKTIIMFLLALVAATGQAQKIKMNEPSFCDYLPLLNANGYVTYSFDTRKLKDTEVDVVVMEYVQGEEPRNVLDFDINMSIGKKLVIGFMPSGNDSIANYLFHFSDGEFGGRLNLKPIFDPRIPDKKHYVYASRPFELAASSEKGKFVPLVLYGSWWYDQDAGTFRFCGDNEIKLDFSSDILNVIPHYFVLGIKIK